MKVKEIMSRNVFSVNVDMDVHSLAEFFIEKNVSGAPVVGRQGELVGIVLEEGLIFQDKKVHLPTFINIFMGFLALGVHKFEKEMRKIAATKVEQIMEKDIYILSQEDTIENVATVMIEKGIYYFPVVENKAVVGIVTKKDIVRAIAQRKIW